MGPNFQFSVFSIKLKKEIKYEFKKNSSNGSNGPKFNEADLSKKLSIFQKKKARVKQPASASTSRASSRNSMVLPPGVDHPAYAIEKLSTVTDLGLLHDGLIFSFSNFEIRHSFRRFARDK